MAKENTPNPSDGRDKASYHRDYSDRDYHFPTSGHDNQKGSPVRIIVISAIIIIAVASAISLSSNNSDLEPEGESILFSPSLDQLIPKQVVTEETSTKKITAEPTPSEKKIEPKTEILVKDDLSGFYSYALEVVNKDRNDHGLKPVSLGNNPSAQIHADDLFENQYFSHWNTKGVKPYVTYTKSEGLGLVKENIAKTEVHCPTSMCLPNSFDVKNEISRLEYNMVYEDEASDWGHRDNILDPFHTHVNFGITFDNNRFYFAQHFETNLVEWDEFSLSKDSILSITGQMPQGFSLENISIFEDPEPKKLSNEILDGKPPYNLGRYDAGTLVGMLVKPPPLLSSYIECSEGMLETRGENNEKNCIEYEIYQLDEKEGYVKLNVDVSKWINKKGLHSVYVNLLDEKSEKPVAVTSLTLDYLK